MERAGASLPSAEELRFSSRAVGPGLWQVDMSVPSVHCGTCISTVESVLKALPEVERARVNLSTKRVSVVWKEAVDGVETDPVNLARAIVSAGYTAHLFTAAEEASDALRNKLIRAV
ncbi:MAG: cation transporter, partial [Alphaproteobacteria bacterium]|nr:cation transporter [Alphaproteobacteria bacterium]